MTAKYATLEDAIKANYGPLIIELDWNYNGDALLRLLKPGPTPRSNPVDILGAVVVGEDYQSLLRTLVGAIDVAEGAEPATISEKETVRSGVPAVAVWPFDAADGDPDVRGRVDEHVNEPGDGVDAVAGTHPVLLDTLDEVSELDGVLGVWEFEGAPGVVQEVLGHEVSSDGGVRGASTVEAAAGAGNGQVPSSTPAGRVAS